MSSRISEFQDRDCAVLGVSTDDIDTHVRWLKTPTQDGGIGPLAFPLAADPEGTICREFGVFVERQKVALRGLFMIDPNGVLQYQVVHSLSVGRSTEEMLRVLDALQSGGLCPGERQVGGPTIDVVAQVRPGSVLGAYEIESELGKGSFGAVYRARDKLLNRTVALKVLHDDQRDATESLLNEARAAAALHHPNVCAIHTIDTTNGAAMIVMEFVEGRTLADLIKQEPLSADRAIDLARQLAAGMASAHEAGVIHGDLKPGNVVVTTAGQAKIMDFGLSRRVTAPNVIEDTLPRSTGSASSGLSGTLGYLAPELARGADPTLASDVFALGLIFYEMLSGERAINGSNVLETLQNIEAFDTKTVASNVPTHLRVLVESTLSRSPEERVTMGEFERALA